jgi:D-3-phosphoglycerate dehydrogenase
MVTSEVSFPREKIKFLLLEGVHQCAANDLVKKGYSVESLKTSLSSQELMDKIRDVHVLGIRSKTKVTAEHLKAAQRLLCLGCFGVGTNQVDLGAARAEGIPVFNAPYGNTRSVAELAAGMILGLARNLGDHNRRMHSGHWKKSSKGSIEVKGKTLGIVGYGHIGQQVGLLAEGLGMEVLFYDKLPRLPLGRANAATSFEELLANSDFVSLHIPARSDGKPLMTRDEFLAMKKGSFLLNLSRGNLLDLDALKTIILEGHLSGAGIDVYPTEPKTNDEPFECVLADVPGVIMAPHQGGSTEEAQEKIGMEVAQKFLRFMEAGTTTGAVNFPQIDLPSFPESHRLLNIHKNIPGALGEINQAIAATGANINAQYLNTLQDIGYLIIDVNQDVSSELKLTLEKLSTNIRTRVLF